MLSKVRVGEHSAASGWWLALIIGLVVTGATALTGLVDWLSIEWGSELWKTATMHMFGMLTATVFLLTATAQVSVRAGGNGWVSSGRWHTAVVPDVGMSLRPTHALRPVLRLAT